MRKLLHLVTAAAVLSIATPALAAPLASSAPSGTTQKHMSLAAEARAHEQSVGQDRFRAAKDVVKPKWNMSYRHYPVSNMTQTRLRELLTDRYFVFRSGKGTDWQIAFHGSNGVVYLCDARKRDEDQNNWRVAPTYIGESGLVYNSAKKLDDPRFGKKAGWFAGPVTYNSQSGELLWGGGKGRTFSGWIQNEYPAVAAEFCPSMPRVAAVNHDQLGRDIRDLVKTAKPVRGVPTIFPGDINDPLTAWMYVYAYPYQ